MIYPVAMLALATGMRRGKEPKTKHGRRNIKVPPSVVAELKAHWKQQQERRLQLGQGRSSGDDLVFADWDGTARTPNATTREWFRALAQLKMPPVSLHALRHTHASQLIAAGVDPVLISRRLGHASPTITLNIYGHLFENSDDRAADVVEAAFAKALTD